MSEIDKLYAAREKFKCNKCGASTLGCVIGMTDKFGRNWEFCLDCMKEFGALKK